MGRPKKYDRDTVVHQAMEVFWVNGYAGTSVSDLTEVTGLNKKSLYNEFGSKEELFDIALKHYNQQKKHQIELLTRKPLGTQNVVDFLSQLAEDADRKGCLLALSINERSLLETRANKQVGEDFQGLRKLLQANLSKDSKRCDADMKALAFLLSAQLFSVAGLGKLNVKKDQIRESIQILIDQLL